MINHAMTIVQRRAAFKGGKRRGNGHLGLRPPTVK